MGSRLGHQLAVCLLVTTVVACEEDRPSRVEVPAASAAAPAVNPAIASAVQAVSQGAVPASGAGASGMGKEPPPNGVFPPGRADAEARAGAAPTLAVGSTGSGPMLNVSGPSFVAGTAFHGELQLSIRLGPRSGLPTIDFTLAIKVEEATEAQGDEQTKHLGVAVEVTDVAPASQQPGRLPDGAAKELAKLKHARVSFRVAPDGSLALLGSERARDQEGVFDTAITSLREAMVTLLMPRPAEPVGVGAFWMVSSREAFGGADTVTYRLARVEKLLGDRAVVSVSMRRFAAENRLDLPGIPPHSVDEFTSESKATLVFAPGLALPAEATLDQGISAALTPTEDPNKRMSVDFSARTNARFAVKP